MTLFFYYHRFLSVIDFSSINNLRHNIELPVSLECLICHTPHSLKRQCFEFSATLQALWYHVFVVVDSESEAVGRIHFYIVIAVTDRHFYRLGARRY